jgi:RNA polymerase sigma-70 factor (ECF subfamily)
MFKQITSHLVVGEQINVDTQDQEIELVTRLRRGDPIALEQLYHRYFDRLYSMVYNRVGKDHGTAEDIIQETFIAVLKSAGKFRGQSKLYTWLCSIAYHKVADFQRRQGQRIKRGEQPYVSEAELEQIKDDQLPLLSKIESEETQQMVEQALSRLPLDYRQVLIFKYVEQMPVSEISQIMHRSPKSVEGILTRARKTLRAYLRE